MKLFKLPDLGEGLPDAVIREWHVKEGEHIAAHETLVTVETAKALVEVPSPWSGRVEKLFVAEGDSVDVGEPLVGFAEQVAKNAEKPTGDSGESSSDGSRSDSGTVVGKIQQSREVLGAERALAAGPERRATPGVRALARRLNVDLAQLQPEGGYKGEYISVEMVRAAATAAAGRQQKSGVAAAATEAKAQKASPARRAMALAMTRSREQVAPMTLCDEVDISAWWGQQSATLRLIRAVQGAATAEPTMNATYREDVLHCADTVNIGLAVDSPKGLYVPVLRDVASRSDTDLLDAIEDYKEQARAGGIAQADLQGATILLSNFGSLAGRFATPVVLPPTVAIVAAGRTYDGVIAADGTAVVRPLLPLSVSADHRAVTGGELARFLRALLKALAKQN